jgi:hypothetical protein
VLLTDEQNAGRRRAVCHKSDSVLDASSLSNQNQHGSEMLKFGSIFINTVDPRTTLIQKYVLNLQLSYYVLPTLCMVEMIAISNRTRHCEQSLQTQVQLLKTLASVSSQLS